MKQGLYSNRSAEAVTGALQKALQFALQSPVRLARPTPTAGVRRSCLRSWRRGDSTAGGALPQKSAEAPVETREELAEVAGVPWERTVFAR
jgi:hypothetical protein